MDLSWAAHRKFSIHYKMKNIKCCTNMMLLCIVDCICCNGNIKIIKNWTEAQELNVKNDDHNIVTVQFSLPKRSKLPFDSFRNKCFDGKNTWRLSISIINTNDAMKIAFNVCCQWTLKFTFFYCFLGFLPSLKAINPFFIEWKMIFPVKWLLWYALPIIYVCSERALGGWGETKHKHFLDFYSTQTTKTS